MMLITRDWVIEIAGQPSHSALGTEFWDLPIVTEYSSSDTFLRLHEANSDGSWPTDLFSKCEGHGVGIVNWPRTQEQLNELLRVLGCVQNCSPSRDACALSD